jgi:glutathione-specific gamma-glutamylcyclotransferase
MKDCGLSGTSLADAGPELWAKLSWESDLWIFAYGSLMWDPGFPYGDMAPAILHGHHRSFCVYSTGHRGTPERPGLVLGLDRGGTCKGVAYCVPAIDVPAALSYLWEREMKSRVYELRELEVQLPHRRVQALAFVVDRAHPDYAAGLGLAATARLIHDGVGTSGTARAYFDSAIEELDRLGAIDGQLSRLAVTVRALARPERRAA